MAARSWRVYSHCGLSCDDSILRTAREMIDPGRQEKWLRFNREDLSAIVPEIKDEMEFHGYEIPQTLQ